MLALSSPSVKTDIFSLHISQAIGATHITMQMLRPLYTTSQLPLTRDILDTYLPSIYTSKCFNENNFTFAKEVKKTELGHLFEHILLEYIYSFKVSMGEKNILVRGETSWNWERDPKGMFHIILNVGKKEKEIFYQSLTPSVELFQLVVQTAPKIKSGARSSVIKPYPLLSIDKKTIG